MNCFQKVLAATGLDGNCQDDGGDIAYLVLSALADKEVALGAALAAQTPPASLPADTYPNNAFQEVDHRLSTYTGYAYDRVARFLHDCSDF